ncbi:MAG: glycosyltransferase family 2 protein [Victivallaceae bacterium]|nr:glycosyltransferase family 2 protein [Victivallaceae bacterium]
MPRVSIVVPVYNVKSYLDACVKSILAQDYCDFEVILVDDGSTDGCGGLCDSYVALDSRVKVFHKSNGGLASAVKYGVERSRGEFLYFVDSDDELSPIGLRIMLGISKKYSVDFVCCQCISDREKVMASTGEGYRVTVFSHDQIMPSVISNGQLNGKFVENSRCGKLFSASKVKANLYLYNPEVKKGEDQMMTLPMLLSCSHVAVVENLYPYYYRLRTNSICGKMDSLLWEKLKKQREQIIRIISELSDDDFTEQLNNSFIGTACVVVGNVSKSANGLSYYIKIISKIVKDRELHESFKINTLQVSGVERLVVLAIKYRMAFLLALFEYYIGKRDKKMKRLSGLKNI